jgi:hypothetical protein
LIRINRFPVLIGIEFEELEWNLKAGIIMARLRYTADPTPLPAANDIEALARTWKRVFNTVADAGTVDEFIENYHKYCE